MLVNEFKLSGKIVEKRVFKANKKTVGLLIEGEFNGTVQCYPIFCYSSLATVALEGYKIGDEVLINGGLRYYFKNQKVDLIAFKMIPIKKEQKDDKLVAINTDENKQRDNTHIDVKTGNIKQICMMEGNIIREFETIKEAANAIKVKKSELERAINEDRPFAGFIWSR